MISNSDNSVANGMIRPRILYVTTEKVVDAFDSSSCRINLPDSIYPEDGFTLVAGLRSFGFEASAWNISEEQRNNRIRLNLTYTPAEILQSGYPNPQTAPILVEKDIIIPDGLYQSLEELFEVLSGSTGTFYTLLTGYYKDPWVSLENQTDLNKMILLPIKWKVESYGFSIGLETTSEQVSSKYKALNDQEYGATQIFPRLVKIIISPTPSSPQLFNLLFTNNVQESSPSIPVSDRHKLGSQNPPGAIQFTLSNFSPDIFQKSFYRPYGTYTYDLEEFGNSYLDTANGLYQMSSLPFSNMPWKSFSTPRLSPLYLDISCQGLPTMNLTGDGLAGNILHRQFLPGSNLGLEGIYQEFNQPIWYRLENRDQITQLIFDFKTESNKWRFYNMNFYLEIVFFEVEEEKAYMDTFNPPSNPDQLTDFVQQYSRNAGNPHGFADPTGRSGTVYFSQDRKRRK